MGTSTWSVDGKKWKFLLNLFECIKSLDLKNEVKVLHSTENKRVCLHNDVLAETFPKTSVKIGEDKITKDKFGWYLSLKRHVQLAAL